MIDLPLYTHDHNATDDPDWNRAHATTPHGRPLWTYAGDATSAVEGDGATPTMDGHDGVWHHYTGEVVDPHAD